MTTGKTNIAVRISSVILPLLLATSCAQVNVPDGRSVDIPTVTPPLEKYKGVNEKRDPVTRIRLGKDVLVPMPMQDDPLPNEQVGPFELRGETLASSLQLILDDYDISLAFESDLAMTNRITVANLRGSLDSVVDRVCQMANLYCHYDDGIMTVKETETFVVDLPPLGSSTAASSSSSSSTGGTTTGGASSSGGYTDISTGLEAIIGDAPTVDATTRVMIYTATQRANKYAQKYFERLRKNTALIVYETHIWEVNLSNENRTGINWEGLFQNVGNFDLEVSLPGGAPAGGANPISITPTYTAGGDITSEAVLDFISEHGTVKTVSQPQLTVLSGSSASLQVEQSENFVSGVQRTPSTTPGVPDTVSTTTSTVDTGLSMSVASAWDQSTVYGTISIQLDELIDIDEFTPDANTTIQLPQTTSRNLNTQIRVRPGDAVLIAGLVTERDDYSGSGPGFLQPLLQTARSASTRNTELVFLLRPRVIAFVEGDESDTVPVVEAPREKRHEPFDAEDITEDVGSIFGNSKVNDVPAISTAKLPMGISATDLTPSHAEPVVMPEDMKDEPAATIARPVSDDDGNEAPDFQGEQIPNLPVPASAMAPAPAAQDASAPVPLTPQSATPAPEYLETVPPPQSVEPPSALPSWLPSQRGR